jgi:hypothetical protein
MEKEFQIQKEKQDFSLFRMRSQRVLFLSIQLTIKDNNMQ